MTDQQRTLTPISWLTRFAVWAAMISAGATAVLVPEFATIVNTSFLVMVALALVGYTIGVVFDVRWARVVPLLFTAAAYLFPTALSVFDYVFDDIAETWLVEAELVAYSLGWVALSAFLVVAAVDESKG